MEILGALDLSWRTVFLGFVCSLAVLPINLLWVVMFRFTKVSEVSERFTNCMIYCMDSPAVDTWLTNVSVNTAGHVQIQENI